MRSTVGASGIGAAIVLTLGASSPADATDPLLVIVEDDALVFTNVPDPDARPIPGLPARRPARRAGPSGSGGTTAMPETIYDAYIGKLAGETGLSPDLIKAVAMAESAFDTHAVSPKGAQGLMQLMPEVAREYGVRDAFDPMQNLAAGSRHLRHLLDEFDGDLRLALAAYNAGAGAVRRSGGVPNYPETQGYIRRIEQLLGLRAPAAGGAAPKPPPRPIRSRRLADGTLMLSN